MKKIWIFFSEIFEMALDYEANVHLVYFSEKLRKNCLLQRNTAAIFSLSKYMVGIHTYTSNLPLNRGKFSEKNHFIRLWKKRCINIVLFVSLRGGRHISMVLFIETCNQTCFSNLWLTLITKKILGLRLMTWKTLEHNFKFCVGLGNNLITFMPPFCELSEGQQKPYPHPFYYVSRSVSCFWYA